MKILVFTTLYPNNIFPNHGVFIKERMTRVAMLDECKMKVVAPVPYYPSIKFGWRQSYSRVQRREIIEGVEIYHPRYFMTPKVGMISYGLMMFFSVLPAVKNIRRNFKFDLIDAHYVYPDGFAAALLGQYFRKPVVMSARGSDINLFAEFSLIRKLIQYTLQRASNIIAVSQVLKESIVDLRISEDKIATIPNGVDTFKFHPFPKHKARRMLELPIDKQILLSVGNLTLNKGFDLLIKALKILFEEWHNRDLCLLVVGEGKIRPELERMVTSCELENQVHLVGAIPHDELYKWYSAADLFCLASYREGWPNVLLESLACGTPVVATAAGGIPEIIKSDTFGLLAKRNEHDLANAISLALERTWNTDEIVQYAKSHTWDRTAISVFEIFKTAIEGFSPDHAIGEGALTGTSKSG